MRLQAPNPVALGSPLTQKLSTSLPPHPQDFPHSSLLDGGPATQPLDGLMVRGMSPTYKPVKMSPTYRLCVLLSLMVLFFSLISLKLKFDQPLNPWKRIRTLQGGPGACGRDTVCADSVWGPEASLLCQSNSHESPGAAVRHPDCSTQNTHISVLSCLR